MTIIIVKRNLFYFNTKCSKYAVSGIEFGFKWHLSKIKLKFRIHTQIL
jgi:hypothetical protein